MTGSARRGVSKKKELREGRSIENGREVFGFFGE